MWEVLTGHKETVFTRGIIRNSQMLHSVCGMSVQRLFQDLMGESPEQTVLNSVSTLL